MPYKIIARLKIKSFFNFHFIFFIVSNLKNNNNKPFHRIKKGQNIPNG